MSPGGWKTLTRFVALRHGRADAPCVIDGPISSTLRTAHVQRVLVPARASRDIGMLDGHQGQRVSRAGALILFLPPCGRGLNPIARLFAWRRYLMRTAQPHTADDMWLNVAARPSIIVKSI